MEITVKKITAARLTPLAGVGLAVVAAGSLLLFSLFAQNASQGLYDPPRGAALTAQPGGTVTPLILPALAVAPQPGTTTTTEPTTGVTLFPPSDVSLVPVDAGAPTVPTPTTGVGGSGSDIGGDTGSAGGRNVAGGSVEGPRAGWDTDYVGDDDGKSKKDKSKGKGKSKGKSKSKSKAEKDKGHGQEKHSKSSSQGNDKARDHRADDDDDDSASSHSNSSHDKSGHGRANGKHHKNKKGKKR